MSILVTGGLGYIGSHIVHQLLELDYSVIIIDNLSNCSAKKLSVLTSDLTNKFNNNLSFYQIDMLDYEKLLNIFENNKILGVIHLAGLKSVGESIGNPELYYTNNIVSTLNLIKCMEKYQVFNLIFSSSATVYGNINQSPIKETDIIGQGITNPYGKTKYYQEEILRDLFVSDSRFNIIILRYFNPIGHLNINFKEEPNGIPNNLFPYVVKVHNGELEKLTIFGSDYNTRDGTCIRDFIHVVDLADSHISSLKYLLDKNNMNNLDNFDNLDIVQGEISVYNVGTGNGTTVLELINAYEKVNNVKINYEFGNRRNGDVEQVYADVNLINEKIGWKSKYTLESMVKI